MNPQVRTALTHLGTFAGGAFAVAMWAGTSMAELQAVFEQGKVVYGEVMKFVAIVTPLATTAYGVYKASTASKIADLEKSTEVKGIVVADPALAKDLGPKVQTTAQDLPPAAKAV